LRDRPLVALTVADLTAWATETPLEAWTRDDLLVHHALVTRIDAAAKGCLPARFATLVTEALLRERYADLARALDRVEGCAELAVTVVRGGLPTPEDQPKVNKDKEQRGTAYLRARAATLGLANKLAEQVELGAGADLVEADHRLAPSDAVLLSSALLVERAAAEAVKARLTRASEDVRILVNGPWPPYSFAVVDVPTREE